MIVHYEAPMDPSSLKKGWYLFHLYVLESQHKPLIRIFLYRDLTSQTKILIEDFYASRLAKPPQGGIALLTYINSGYLGSLKEVKDSTDSSALALL
mmetsp:Transcript_9436/g.12274  ORF Transcript_9436/g.12274 Transcript_9436/m.12274 type:complete len:96 (-) Transcript_9436:1518-1805(-)